MSTTTEQHTDTEAVLAVLDERHAAVAAGDAERAVATCAPDVVVASLAPPLLQPIGSSADAAAALGEWIASFETPPRLAHREPVVHVDGDVAFVHALSSMTGTKGGTFTLWYRSTFGLRRTEGRWLIVHQHESVPFHMDGSFRAAVELQP